MSGCHLVPRLLMIAMVGAMLAGCQTFGSQSLVASSAPQEISGPAASAIAGDMVSRLAEHVGPGAGSILLRTDGSPFGGVLESSLKAWGYTVVTNQKSVGEKLIPLAYIIGSYDGQVLARFSTGTLDLGRAYTTTSAGATPTSPLSVMQRG